MNEMELQRLQAKTPEQRFLNLMQQDFNYAPKIAHAILEEAKDCLEGASSAMRPGQMRVVLLKRDAPHGRALSETETVEAILTVDAGAEDVEVEQKHGRLKLRQVRIQRMLDEALAQGGVAGQEDLARLLQVSVRTIKRDCAALMAEGTMLPTRGKLKGIGRGQTHKAQIVKHWLQGATYDQIEQITRHSLSSIKRYIQAFVRVFHLRQEGFAEAEISLLLHMSPYLVSDYLAVYEQNQTSFTQQRLQEQVERLSKRSQTSKKGAL